jgi:hypothetical protein
MTRNLLDLRASLPDASLDVDNDATLRLESRCINPFPECFDSGHMNAETVVTPQRSVTGCPFLGKLPVNTRIGVRPWPDAGLWR